MTDPQKRIRMQESLINAMHVYQQSEYFVFIQMTPRLHRFQKYPYLPPTVHELLYQKLS